MHKVLSQWHNKHKHLVHLSVFPRDQRVAVEIHKTMTAINMFACLCGLFTVASNYM